MDAKEPARAVCNPMTAAGTARSRRSRRCWAHVEAVASGTGAGVATLLAGQYALGAPPGVPAHVLAALAGLGAARVVHALCGSARPAILSATGVLVGGPWAVGAVTLVPMPPTLPLSFTIGVLSAVTVPAHTVVRRSVVALGSAWMLVACTAAPAAAWSVDEPGPRTAAMVAGDGIVEHRDTHAFLIHRAAVILRQDGHSAIAAFLQSPDPNAARLAARGPGPPRRTPTYLWRMQLGARDADRSLKPQMPDHFFNWWTHSGKGLIAGASAATWAEEQYADAVAAWKAGDRSRAMYRLGAAVHLVDDACAPPHQFVLAPNHRAYEEWALHDQDVMAVGSGGIYREDFRVSGGHGGPEWSSDHTRGWVDECAHRAAELVPNAALPVPLHPSRSGPQWRTAAHFRDTQRLTAGYIAFFFDEVGGP
jgi:hypothetical protein